ncbi:helix-turn-helix DNA-binding domain protein [Arthrobacter phage Abba]|uniref:Helix-turn-helix DNA-binding domain protein n=1 Tax=Arthrobacter phage Abba TaxID=2713256 RepID=A0A6G8R2J1_9CAUD|nr:DNA binding protein [Arthrobacter phage Abba]QIN94396.1 helix-turn-helix DNA-binding domain protein [Arthrobacter phage Abba]
MATTKLLGYVELAELLGISVESARTYNGRAQLHRRQAEETGDASLIRPGDLPAPDQVFGKSPVWEEKTIDRWLKNRPGQGVNLDTKSLPKVKPRT